MHKLVVCFNCIRHVAQLYSASYLTANGQTDGWTLGRRTN